MIGFPFLRRIQSAVLGVVARVNDDGLTSRLSASFRATERSGLMLASAVRAVAVGVLVTVFAGTQAYVGDGFIALMLMPLGIAVIGLLQFETLRRWPAVTWSKYAFVALDCTYLATFLIFRHDLSGELPPVTLAVKEGALLFFVAFLVQSAFSYSPRFIGWTAICICVAWMAVVVAAAIQPGTYVVLPAGAEVWGAYSHPNYLPLIKVSYDFVIFLCIAAGLIVSVWRSRELVLAAATSEKARANLARHFSPKLLDELSSREQPFGAVRRQSAAVLFADIRGFTTKCETMAPEDAIAFLRQFHARMEDVIFRHGGTLDKILGDGLLAVFGVPDQGAADAGDALACAFDMVQSVADWNEERRQSDQFSVQIGIGLHYGPVMTGDVGSERLMTFTVVGDTVNVASRLQSLSKEIGTMLVASQALVEAVKEEVLRDAQLVDELKLVGPTQLRGRESETIVYALQK
ncbi:MAG: adenylate/guanylate cyclase domain-containing protein [Micropepsaceae bacterium]